MTDPLAEEPAGPGGAAGTGGPGPAGVPYQSLYRRFRPQRFAEVRGQDHLTTALRNAVRDGRVAHAYLFSGPRGTGKTSTARILAKALNCEVPEEGEPCGRCASCRSIAAGSSFDVHELDAASNNGVEAMRDLVARAALATPGRWKVYIVDEVHMLSTAASNALLKTLEEPPEHVVFVLATTDPQKVLPTIRSRTQHYELHLLDEEVLAPLLAEVAEQAALELPEGALGAALRRGRGSARDALSALDQVVAAGVIEDDTDSLREVVRGLAAREAGTALSALDAAVRGGRDPQQLAVELVERLRTGFLALVAPGAGSPLPGRAEAAEEARQLGTARCVRAMELVGSAIVAMRDAPEPRITLEVALLRLAHPEADDSPPALLERLERLERRLAEGGTPAPAASPSPPPAPAPPPPPPSPPAPAPGGARPALGAYRRRHEGGPPPPATSPPIAPPVAVGSPSSPPPQPAPAPPAGGGSGSGQPGPGPEAGAAVGSGGTSEAGGPGGAGPSRDELVTAWGDQLLTALRPKVRAIYQAGHFVGSDDGVGVLALPNAAHLVHAEPLRGEVAELLSRHFGRPVGLRLVVEGAGEARPAAATPAEGPASEAAARAEAPAVSAALPAGEDEDEEQLDLPDEGEPFAGRGPEAPGISSAEDRLLRAFPGAEEVGS